MSFVTNLNKNENTIKRTTVNNNTATVTIPFLQKDFIGFKEAIAFKESQGRYQIINQYGYLGKYQFGKSSLKHLGITNTHHFLHTPELQEKAFVALCKINKWILRKEIKRFSGVKINGVVITESGILAAAHLAGATNVKRYLKTGGQYRFKDAFGTSMASYLKRFAHYDVSNIKADRLAKV